MYIDSEIAVTVDPTDDVTVTFTKAGDYQLTVRDHLGIRQLVVRIPGEKLVELVAAAKAAQHLRLIEATEGVA